MILIKGLCTGQSSLPKADIVTFTAMMKSAKPPQSIRFTENGKVPHVLASFLKKTLKAVGFIIFQSLCGSHCV